MTQEQFANQLSVTKATVSKWELAQSYPDIMLLPQIAGIFGISIDELMDYSIPETPIEQVSYRATLVEDKLKNADVFPYGTIEKTWLSKGGITDENGKLKEWKYEVLINFDFTDPAVLQEIQATLSPNEYRDIVEKHTVNGHDTEIYHLWVCRDEILRFRVGDRSEIKKATLRLIEKGIMNEDDLY